MASEIMPADKRAPYVSQPHEGRVIRQSRLFLMLLFFGITSIAVGRWLQAIFWVLGVLLPMLFIIVYAVWNWRAEFDGTTKHEVADNSYYLGFLYFLTSLGISLVLFDIKNPDVGQIVHGFGTALFTSICGLATRIVLLQSSEMPTDDRESERELYASVERFKASLQSSADLLRNASHAISSQLSEHHDALTAGSAAAAEKVTSVVINAVQALELKLEAIDVPVGLLTDRVGPAMSGLGAGVETLANDVKQVSADLKRGASAIASTATKIATFEAELGEAVGRVMKALEAMPEHAQALESIQHLLSDVGHVVEKASSAAAHASVSVDAFTKRAVAVTASNEFQHMTIALGGSAKALDELGRSANSSSTAVTRMDESASAAGEVIRRMAQSAEAVSKIGGELIAAEIRVAEQVSTTLNGVKEVVGEIRKLLDSQPKLNASVGELIKKVDEVNRRVDLLNASVEQMATKASGIRRWFGG